MFGAMPAAEGPATDLAAGWRALKARLLAAFSASALLLAAAVVQQHERLGLDASTAVLLAGDPRTARAVERLGRGLDGALPLGVLVEHEALFSDAGRSALAALGDTLGALPGVSDVKSLTHSSRPMRRPGFSLDPTKLVEARPFLPEEPTDAAGWAAIETSVLADPLARDLFVSADGRLALVLVVGQAGPGADTEALTAALEAAAESHREDFVALHFLGLPFVEREVGSRVRHEASVMASAGLALVGLVLLVVLRSAWAAACVTVLTASALLAALLLLVLTGAGLNLYTALLLPVVAALGLAFALHLLSALLDGERQGREARAALADAVALVAPASLLAAATACVGLLALRVSDVALVQAFGTLGALSALCALVLVLGPAWLFAARRPGSLIGRAPATQPVAAHPWALAWVATVRRWRRTVLALAAALALLAVPGVAAIRPDLRALAILGEESPAAAGLRRVDRELGGLNLLEFEVDSGTEGGAGTRPVLQFLLALRERALALPGGQVSAVYDLAQVVQRVAQVLRGGSLDAGLPASDVELALVVSLLALVDAPLMELLVDERLRVARVAVRASEMPAREWLSISAELQRFVEEATPPGVTVALQAGVHDLLQADRRMVAAQRGSLGLAVLMLALVLALVLRSPRQALTILAANLLPLLLVLGLMGFLGVALNSITVLLAALALGVAVDDAIHILLARRRAAGSDELRLAAALGAKLRPVVATSLLMSVTFALFAASSFPPVAAFGLLGAAAMAGTCASTLVLLPALLLPRRRT